MSQTSRPTAPMQGSLQLSDWGVIRAQGEDARSFLHGQLTQDVLHLDAGRARLAGYCSAKGRLLASFVVWIDAGTGDVLLACSADLLPATLKRLSMFVLRAKCRLSDASAALPVYGLAGAAVPDTPIWTVAAQEGAACIRLPDAAGARRALWVGGMPPTGPALTTDAWRWLEVHSGVPRITAATSEQFVPQMVNLEVVGGVDFQKGCYPGQEVVARSQYRGTIKRRSFLVESDAPLSPGQEVFDVEDPAQPAGLVVLAAASEGAAPAALVELKIAASTHALRAGLPDGPALRVTALPYEIPIETA